MAAVTRALHVTAEEETQILAVLRTLKQVVEEFGPDYRYQFSEKDNDDQWPYKTCLYVKDEEPDCLAAKVLVRLGLPVEALKEIEGIGLSSFESINTFGYNQVPKPSSSLPYPRVKEKVEGTVRKTIDLIGHKAVNVLGAAQARQDLGSTWGEARLAAIWIADHNYKIGIK